MVPVLAHGSLQQAQNSVAFRQHQSTQLAIYYNNHFPSPPILIAHGLEQTGKLETIEKVLGANKINHAVIKSKDCLSQRHLLSRIFATCVRQLGETEHVEKYDRIDGLNALVVNLQNMFEKTDEKFVLVIDSVDRQRGASHTLLPALAKLGDLIPKLSLILTTSSSRSLPLHRAGIPFIHFPPFSRAEMITTLLKEPVPIASNLSDDFTTIPDSQLISIYKSFITTVYDTLTTHTSSTSLKTYRLTCNRLWPRFIWPMLSGATPQKRHNLAHSSTLQWDFARLLSHNRALFQRSGEKALLSQLTADPNEAITFTDLLAIHTKNSTKTPTTLLSPTNSSSDLPPLTPFTTILLLSSYLASHTPPKHDIILFSRLSSSSTHKRKYLSSALSKSRSVSRASISGVRKTPSKKALSSQFSATSADDAPTTPSKTPQEGKTKDGLAGEKTPKSTRLLLEKTSHIPRPFTLERVVAILRTVHTEGMGRLSAADRVYGEMAELERLRLVVRCSGAGGVGTGNGTGGNGAGGDDGILEEKWRVNVSREFVVRVGKGCGIGLEGWEID